MLVQDAISKFNVLRERTASRISRKKFISTICAICALSLMSKQEQVAHLQYLTQHIFNASTSCS